MEILKRKRGRPIKNLPKQLYRLMVNPQTYARYSRNEIYIPAKAHETPEKMEEWEWKIFRKVERYNQYKFAVQQEALRNEFIMPNEKIGIIFFFPVSKSWSGILKRRRHLSEHIYKPDKDNLEKALLDALRAKYTGLANDCEIWNSSISKRWVNAPDGWIEIHLLESNWDDQIIQDYHDHNELLSSIDSL